jgi:hypothetical protein
MRTLRSRTKTDQLPEPQLTPVYRFEATVGEPLDLGDTAQGRRRIIQLTGGTFTGPGISGSLVPGVSADWQTVLPDGTALGEIRYTLKRRTTATYCTCNHAVCATVAPRSSPRLTRGDAVDPSEYVFRTTTQIETSAPKLDWLNKGVFIGVGGRRPDGVTYEIYLVQ